MDWIGGGNPMRNGYIVGLHDATTSSFIPKKENYFQKNIFLGL